MKQCRLFLIAMAMAVVSCQSNFIEVPVVDRPAESDVTSVYAISEEEALNKLEEFMTAIEGDETRSSRRIVEKVHKVSSDNILGQTRSSECDDIDNLLYIVEFEDGEGSAILGADRRLAPVYAVLDETTLTVEDFSNAVTGNNTDDISTYTAGLIADNVRVATLDFGDPAPLLPPLDSLRTDGTYRTTTTTVLSKVYPLLDTKWGQYSPYNDRFPLTDNGLTREPAGCGTIAVAQVLNYLTFPNNLVLNGHTHDWSIITQFDWDNNIDNAYYKNCLAQFIYDLALEMNVHYEDKNDGGIDLGTSVAVADSEALFKQLGYTNVNFESLTVEKARNMIFNNKPFYAYGVDVRQVVVPRNVAHVWVIDGWIETYSVVREIVEDQGLIISNTICDTYYTHYAHCNFGWSGKCDGYYLFTNFNTRNRLSSDMVESEYGDVIGTDRWTFNQDLNMIKYSY